LAQLGESQQWRGKRPRRLAGGVAVECMEVDIGHLFSRSADRGDDVVERFSGSIGSGHMPERDRLHHLVGDRGWVDLSSGDD
jgi:hypothetical protein